MNILDPQGPIGAADKTILIDSLAIMLPIVLPTIVAIFAFAYCFRASNTRAFYWPDWEYSGRPVKGARVGGPKPVGEGKDRDDGRQHDRQHDRKRVDQDGLFGGSDRTLWIEKIHRRPRKWNRYPRRCRQEVP